MQSTTPTTTHLIGNVPLDKANSFFTSRSAVECYQECKYRRWLTYLYKGRGIVPKTKSAPLSTGIAVHIGVGSLMEWWKNLDSVKISLNTAVENAVELAVTAFKENASDAIKIKQVDSSDKMEYAIAEQLALVEALIRVWSIVELPMLMEYYDIWATEREMLLYLGSVENIDATNTELDDTQVWLQGKVDAILITKDHARDFVNYSLKTCSMFTWRVEKSYAVDLQSLTECEIVQRYLIEENDRRLLDRTKSLTLLPYFDTEAERAKMTEIIKRRIPLLAERLIGTKFCYLVKGKRERNKYISGVGDDWYTTNSNLIYAYRKDTPAGPIYAHSFRYPEPSNASGYGTIGKGWDRIPVWSCKELGVKKWIELIFEGEIQKVIEPKDFFKIYCITPSEVRRKEQDREDAILEIWFQERVIAKWFNKYRNLDIGEPELLKMFPKNRESCYWPDECDNIPICHGKENYTGQPLANLDVMLDPVGSGLYEFRTPHHDMEREQLAD